MKIIATFIYNLGLFAIGFYLAPLVNCSTKLEWWRMVGMIVIVIISYAYLRGKRFYTVENHNTWKVFRKNK